MPKVRSSLLPPERRRRGGDAAAGGCISPLTGRARWRQSPRPCRHRSRLRRGGRVVECACLESTCRRKPTGGSNPPLSASLREFCERRLSRLSRDTRRRRTRHPRFDWASQLRGWRTSAAPSGECPRRKRREFRERRLSRLSRGTRRRRTRHSRFGWASRVAFMAGLALAAPTTAPHLEGDENTGCGWGRALRAEMSGAQRGPGSQRGQFRGRLAKDNPSARRRCICTGGRARWCNSDCSNAGWWNPQDS